MSKKLKSQEPTEDEDQKYPLPIYDKKDDIYSQGEELGLDEQGQILDDDSEAPEDNDLDVPGSELDDDNEAIGEEDEENNYYSLGGDNHDDLEEDRDELDGELDDERN